MTPHLTWIATSLASMFCIASLSAATPSGRHLSDEGSTASPTQIDAMHHDNRQIVDDAFRRWAAGGNGFFDAVLSSDVVWTIEGSGPHAGTIHGRDALIQRAVRPLAARMASPLRPLRWQVWADGDRVIVRWEGAGVARDGLPYRNRYAWILRMRDGRATEVSAFLDLPAYADLLQRIPEHPASGDPR